jgi:hypothetical protein
MAKSDLPAGSVVRVALLVLRNNPTEAAAVLSKMSAKQLAGMMALLSEAFALTIEAKGGEDAKANRSE